MNNGFLLTVETCFPSKAARVKKQTEKTYNTEDSQVVTDPSTNSALSSLSMGERTGSRVFWKLWSYVLVSFFSMTYTVHYHLPDARRKRLCIRFHLPWWSPTTATGTHITHLNFGSKWAGCNPASSLHFTFSASITNCRRLVTLGKSPWRRRPWTSIPRTADRLPMAPPPR